MKALGLTLAMLGLLVGCAAQPDRILYREEGPDNRCHMKIETYGDPNVPAEREIVDYHGPCDERPVRR